MNIRVCLCTILSCAASVSSQTPSRLTLLESAILTCTTFNCNSLKELIAEHRSPGDATVDAMCEALRVRNCTLQRGLSGTPNSTQQLERLLQQQRAELTNLSSIVSTVSTTTSGLRTMDLEHSGNLSRLEVYLNENIIKIDSDLTDLANADRLIWASVNNQTVRIDTLSSVIARQSGNQASNVSLYLDEVQRLNERMSRLESDASSEISSLRLFVNSRAGSSTAAVMSLNTTILNQASVQEEWNNRTELTVSRTSNDLATLKGNLDAELLASRIYRRNIDAWRNSTDFRIDDAIENVTMHLVAHFYWLENLTTIASNFSDKFENERRSLVTLFASDIILPSVYPLFSSIRREFLRTSNTISGIRNDTQYVYSSMKEFERVIGMSLTEAAPVIQSALNSAQEHSTNTLKLEREISSIRTRIDAIEADRPISLPLLTVAPVTTTHSTPSANSEPPESGRLIPDDLREVIIEFFEYKEKTRVRRQAQQTVDDSAAKATTDNVTLSDILRNQQAIEGFAYFLGLTKETAAPPPVVSFPNRINIDFSSKKTLLDTIIQSGTMIAALVLAGFSAFMHFSQGAINMMRYRKKKSKINQTKNSMRAVRSRMKAAAEDAVSAKVAPDVVYGSYDELEMMRSQSDVLAVAIVFRVSAPKPFIPGYGIEDSRQEVGKFVTAQVGFLTATVEQVNAYRVNMRNAFRKITDPVDAAWASFTSGESVGIREEKIIEKCSLDGAISALLAGLGYNNNNWSTAPLTLNSLSTFQTISGRNLQNYRECIPVAAMIYAGHTIVGQIPFPALYIFHPGSSMDMISATLMRNGRQHGSGCTCPHCETMAALVIDAKKQDHAIMNTHAYRTLLERGGGAAGIGELDAMSAPTIGMPSARRGIQSLTTEGSDLQQYQTILKNQRALTSKVQELTKLLPHVLERTKLEPSAPVEQSTTAV